MVGDVVPSPPAQTITSPTNDNKPDSTSHPHPPVRPPGAAPRKPAPPHPKMPPRPAVTSPTGSSPVAAGVSNGPPQPKRRKDQEPQNEPALKSVEEMNHEEERPTTNSQPAVPKQLAKRPPPPRKLPEKKPPLPSVQPDPEQAGGEDVSVSESPKPARPPPVKKAPPPLPQERPAVESPDIAVSHMTSSSSL